MNLHQSLHRYPTGFAGKTLTLHIGAGFGEVTILQVSERTVLLTPPRGSCPCVSTSVVSAVMQAGGGDNGSLGIRCCRRSP